MEFAGQMLRAEVKYLYYSNPESRFSLWLTGLEKTMHVSDILNAFQ